MCPIAAPMASHRISSAGTSSRPGNFSSCFSPGTGATQIMISFFGVGFMKEESRVRKTPKIAGIHKLLGRNSLPASPREGYAFEIQRKNLDFPQKDARHFR